MSKIHPDWLICAADIALLEIDKACTAYVSTRNGARWLSNTPLLFSFNSAPLVTLRKTAWKNALREMEWFLSGSSNINDLHPSVRHWWKPWADESGEIKNNYSKQFRKFGEHFLYLTDDEGAEWQCVYPGFDQVSAFIDGIVDHPFSARHVMTTWHSEEMYSQDTPITNCHGSLIQATVYPDQYGGAKTFRLCMVQRSVDTWLGLPHNWIQYWAFGLWIQAQTGLTFEGFDWLGVNCHVYDDHRKALGRLEVDNFERSKPIQLKYEPSGPEFKADDFDLHTPIDEPAIIGIDTKLTMNV